MNESLLWILGSGLLMALFSLVGGLVVVFPDKFFKRLTLPLVALAAGSMWGGAFFNLLPESFHGHRSHQDVFMWVTLGFLFFFILEQFIHWHHCHKGPDHHHAPVTHLSLIADGIHNFIDGLAISSIFLVDIKAGIIAFVAALAHEIPQEFGDFGLLVHNGWSKTKALLFNFYSALTYPVGGLVVYFLSNKYDMSFLVPFTAGSFIYIAATDLVPEFRHFRSFKSNTVTLITFILGVGIVYFLAQGHGHTHHH